MSRLGFNNNNKSVVVYHGEGCLGELDTIPVRDQNFQFPNSEIRIHHISLQSERCPPLAILQTISSFSVRCKLESSFPTEQPHLINLHASCFYESKTAVVVLGDEEIHLVAMPSKQKKFPCFWCFAVPLGLYDSCLVLLNLRCLAIVFDLDETLIVANTMKSFEDRIEALRVWISREIDQVRVAGMVAEMRRYMDDRMLLKQYTDNDCVVDNGKTYKAQLEEVPALSDTHERIVRPVIRLPDKNIVLTRINPEIRDTSVVVRLRPAWEDLRSYLTAKGRKRFEVYVCTMAERDYALEMWRLLDPGAHLISLKQLFNRVVCVKSGARKSLLNVFRDRACHPRMAMVIDDRSKVWEDKDQPRVHVVPAFTPYYAPQAETANAVPVLCVARNVACNVRGCFFKEFDEHLIRKISEVFYEDEVISLPPVPDVSSYMMSEETGSLPNGNANAPITEGMSGSEVERRLHQSDERSIMDSTTHSVTNTLDLRSEVSLPPVAIVPNVVGLTSSTALVPPQKSSLLGAPVTRDLRNQNPGQAPLLSRVPAQMSSLIPPQGGWLVDGDASRAHPNNRPSIIQDCDPLKSDKMRGMSNPFLHNTPCSTATGFIPHASDLKVDEAFSGADLQKQNYPTGIQPTEGGVSQNVTSSSGKEFQPEAGKLNMLSSHLCIAVLQEIGQRCNAKVEFKSVVSTSKDLQFSVEVSFTGEKIGVGMGKTRKDAQQQAAENALHRLAEKYVAHAAHHSGAADRDFDKLSLGDENGFLWDIVNSGSSEAMQEDGLERMPEATEVEPASSLVNQQQQKRVGSPRLPQSIPSKRPKEDQSHGTQSLPSRQQKNGHHVS